MPSVKGAGYNLTIDMHTALEETTGEELTHDLIAV